MFDASSLRFHQRAFEFRPHHGKWVKAGALLVFTCVTLLLLFKPYHSPERRFSPQYLPQWAGPAEQKVLDTSEPLKVKILVQPPAALAGGLLSSGAVLAWPKDSRDAALADAMAHPYRYPSTFGLRFFKEGNGGEGCRIEAEWQGHNAEPVDCDAVPGRGLIHFRFKSEVPILPGPHELNLRIHLPEDKRTDDAFKLSAKVHGDGWMETWSRASVNPFVALRTWIRRDGWPALLYVALLLAMALLASIRPRRVKLIAASLFLMTASIHFLIAHPISGHDETAHADMLFHAILEHRKAQGPVDETKATSEFRSSFHAYSRQTDFYLLHGVATSDPSHCPHWFLSLGCGHTEKPSWLYARYAKVLSPWLFESNSPARRILRMGRMVNAVELTLVAGLLFVLLPSPVAIVAFPLLALCGAFFAQAPSISNDVPMYLLGFLLLALAGSVLGGTLTRLKGFAGILILFLCAALLFRQVDRSWVTTLPFLGSLSLFCAFLLRPGAHTHGNAGVDWRRTLAGTAVILATAALPLVLVKELGRLHPDLLNSLIAVGTGFIPDLSLLGSLRGISHAGIAKILLVHIESIHGTFVWGHSYFARPIYLAWIGVLAVSIPFATRKIFLSTGSAGTGNGPLLRALLACALVGTAFGGYFLGVAAAGSAQFHAAEVVSHSFLKARLHAPAAVMVFLFPLLALLGAGEKLRERILFKAIPLYLFFVGLYYLPKFYIADLF